MNSPFRFCFFLLGLLGSFLMGDSSPLFAQNWGQRVSLRDALNAAKDNLPYTSGFAQIDLSDLGFGLEGLRDDFSGCRELRPEEELWVSYLEPSFPQHIVVSHIIQPEGTIDVPTDSHLLVCHLNEWLSHAWVGPQTFDTGMAKYGMDVACTDRLDCPNCQNYFMGPAANIAHPQLVPWVWFLPSNYTVRMGSGPTPFTSTVAAEIDPEWNPGATDLIYSIANPVMMAYREQPVVPGDPYVVHQQRAHFKLIFDYTKKPDGFDDWDYAFPVGTFPESGGDKKRLKSVEMIFQDRSYGSNDACPYTGSITPDYDPNVSKAIVKVEYDEGGTGKTWERTITSAVEGVNDDPTANDSPDDANKWLWGARGWNNYLPTNWMKFDIDEHGYLFLTVTDKSNNEETFWSLLLVSPESPAEYCSGVFPIDGAFDIDHMTGKIIYVPGSSCSSCDPIPVTCLSFCDQISGYRTVDNVLAASARTFSDQWEYDPASDAEWKEDGSVSIFGGAQDNDYQRGKSGKWRPQEEFVYRSKIKPGTVGDMVYDNSGVFVDKNGSTANAFRVFDWMNESANAQTEWLNASTVTQYAPSGEAVEEHNIINIYSAAKLAHEDIVPGIVAANALYSSLAFESFEEREDAHPSGPFAPHLVSTCAHSGKKSYELVDGSIESIPLVNFTLTDQIVNQGLLIKLWVKRTYGNDPPTGQAPFKVKIGEAMPLKDLSDDGLGTLQSGKIHRVAQTGEWTLYQLVKKDFSASDIGTAFDIKFIKNLSGQSVWVDDIRLQPLDAQATCYVYDPNTLRLLTQFDDQHFGAYYQYNGEGKLVRTLRETERGLMTVAETHYHSLAEPRDPTGTTSSGPDISSSIHFNNSSELMSASGASGTGAGFDLLSLNVDRNGPSLSILGSKNPSLPDLQALRDLAPPGINSDALRNIAPGVSELEKIALVKELIEIDKKRAELANELPDQANTKARAELEHRMAELNERREHILRDKLGMTEGEVEMLYKDLEEEKKGTEEKAGSTENNSPE